MPWSETPPIDQKTQFIADYLRRSLSISELCTNYGISRKTGYKWLTAEKATPHVPDVLGQTVTYPAGGRGRGAGRLGIRGRDGPSIARPPLAV